MLQAPRRCTCFFWRQPTTMTDTVTCAVHGTTTTNTSTDFTFMSTFPLAPQWQQRRVLPSLDDIVRVVAPSSSSSPSPAGDYDHIQYIHLLIIVSCPQCFSVTSHPALCTCMYVCMYICMCLCICFNLCKYTYNACMYVYMYFCISNNDYLAHT